MLHNLTPESEEAYLVSKHPSFRILAPRPYIVAAMLVLLALTSLLATSAALQQYRAVKASLSPAPQEVAYRNDIYGFGVVLPASWRGFTVAESQKEIWNVSGINGSTVIGHYPLIEIVNPLSTATVSIQTIPIEVFTKEQWTHINSERSPDWTVSAAPIPPRELGRNSKYVFALPPRYNYAFLPGWEEVQRIIDSKPLVAFEPAATTATSDWLTYRNQEDAYEIQYPPSFTVADGTKLAIGGNWGTDLSWSGVGTTFAIPADTSGGTNAAKIEIGSNVASACDKLSFRYPRQIAGRTYMTDQYADYSHVGGAVEAYVDNLYSFTMGSTCYIVNLRVTGGNYQPLISLTERMLTTMQSTLGSN